MAAENKEQLLKQAEIEALKDEEMKDASGGRPGDKRRSPFLICNVCKSRTTNPRVPYKCSECGSTDVILY